MVRRTAVATDPPSAVMVSGTVLSPGLMRQDAVSLLLVSVSLFLSLSVCLSVCRLSVCLSICLSACLWG